MPKAYKPTQPVGKTPTITPIFDDGAQFRQKKFISKSASATPTASNFYIVPDNKIFILLSASYSATGNNTTGLGNGEVYSSNPEIKHLIYTAGVSVPADTVLTVNQNANFGNGIAFYPKTSFSMTNGSSPQNNCVITGYEIDTKFAN